MKSKRNNIYSTAAGTAVTATINPVTVVVVKDVIISALAQVSTTVTALAQ